MNQTEAYIVRCISCGTKNRIPVDKVELTTKCGKCGSVIPTEDLKVNTPIIVSDADFDTTVLKSPLPVLLDCWATWCGPCQMVSPIIDQLAKEWSGKVKVCKLNVDENPITAAKFQIQSIPTLIIFDAGTVKDMLIGAIPKKQIVKKMSAYFL